MKSIYTTIIAVFFIHSSMQAKELPIAQAKDYAIAAFQLYSGKTVSKKSLAIIDFEVKATNSDTPNLYAFNMTGGGFVILSADDQYAPVLGFSDEGRIDFSHLQANIGLWGELSRHEENIIESRKRNLKSNKKTQQEWATIKQIATTGAIKKQVNFSPVVSPLTTSKWNQDGFYNGSCPADVDGPNGRTYCGCLPVALSMLLKYYENPAPGNGFISYNDPIYGPQEVNLCGQEFDYANMPDVLTEENTVLADFIYDVGKATRTFYSTFYTGTYVSTVQNALIYYFGFDQSMQAYSGTDGESYSNVLKKEFDEGRIVFLSGWSIDEEENAEIGHTWLADGYGYSESGEEYMHFNWGWGGSNNGWFLDRPGLWTPHENNESEAVIPYYWYRYTVYNIKPSGEDCTPPNPAIASADPQEDYAYLYYRSPIEEASQYRYRKVGDDEWITSDPVTEHFLYAGNLNPGTDYEFQVARNCCSGFSSFTNSYAFTTLGESVISEEEISSDCASEDADGLFTTSVSDQFAYVYTARPYGQVDNQFRYRAVGSDEWIESEENPTHYLALSNLNAGTSYEYQVRHECEVGVWSEYSDSFTFATTGDRTEETIDDEEEEIIEEEESVDDMETIVDNDCPTIPLENFAVGFATTNGATAYLSKLSGGQTYVFRYRATGTTQWTEIGPVSSTAVNLSGLNANTRYDVQVAQDCGSGLSEFSQSHEVTTLN